MQHNKPSGLAIGMLLGGFGTFFLYMYLPDKQFISILGLNTEQLDYKALIVSMIAMCTIGGVRLYYDLRYGETYMDTINLRGENVQNKSEQPITRKRFFVLLAIACVVFAILVSSLFLIMAV